jgi:hypothetical protein
MSRFILAILVVPFANPVTVLAHDDISTVDSVPPVKTVKSEIPQALDAPKPPPKPEVKASTKTSEAKKKPKKKN